MTDEILRVTALDSDRLQNDMVNVASSLVRSRITLPGIRGFDNVQQWTPEIKSFVQGLLWWYTTRVQKPSPADLLQNVKLHSALEPLPNNLRPRLQNLSKSQRCLLGFCTVILPYVITRLKIYTETAKDDYLALSQAARRGVPVNIDRKTERLSTLHSLCTSLEQAYYTLVTLNFVAFLFEGRFRNVAERLLGIETRHVSPGSERQLSLSLLQRHLWWESITDLLQGILPLINMAQLRATGLHLSTVAKNKYAIWSMAIVKYLYARLGWPIPSSPVGEIEDAASPNTSELKKQNEILSDMANKSCSICGTSPITAAHNGRCGHPFCYYCGASSLMMDPDARCPACGDLLGYCSRQLPPTM